MIRAVYLYLKPFQSFRILVPDKTVKFPLIEAGSTNQGGKVNKDRNCMEEERIKSIIMSTGLVIVDLRNVMEWEFCF
jgi:hypothetical protein